MNGPKNANAIGVPDYSIFFLAVAMIIVAGSGVVLFITKRTRQPDARRRNVKRGRKTRDEDEVGGKTRDEDEVRPY